MDNTYVIVYARLNLLKDDLPTLQINYLLYFVCLMVRPNVLGLVCLRNKFDVFDFLTVHSLLNRKLIALCRLFYKLF